jgi:hypothetical protein
MALPRSATFFVRAYDRECTETFWDGHVRAFDFLGGVSRRITYDNSRVMVAMIIGPRQRELTGGASSSWRANTRSTTTPAASSGPTRKASSKGR